MRDLSVVLFGATGFIGSHLAARLAERTMTVVVPTRHEAHAMHPMPSCGAWRRSSNGCPARR